jgi:hypothetical protein
MLELVPSLKLIVATLVKEPHPFTEHILSLLFPQESPPYPDLFQFSPLPHTQFPEVVCYKTLSTRSFSHESWLCNRAC